MERRELEHRRKEFHREDIIKQLKNDAVINGILDSDERIDDKRRLRAQKVREEELRTHEALIEVYLFYIFESSMVKTVILILGLRLSGRGREKAAD